MPLDRARMKRGRPEHTPDHAPLDGVAMLPLESLMDEFRSMLREEMATFNECRDDILTLEEAAQELKLSTKTVVKHVKPGGLPGTRVGREHRFLRSNLVRWIKSNAAFAGTGKETK